LAGVAKIVEIRYDPPGSDLAGENLVLANVGGSALTLTGAVLVDLANHSYTFPTFTLASGARVRIWTKAGTDSATDLYMQRGAAIWNNVPGDMAILRDAGGSVLDTYSYWAVPATPVGLGGGGAMYTPALSPHEADLMLLGCDMGGLYRSQDAGGRWEMVDGREMHVQYGVDQSSTLPREPTPKVVAFHPTQPDIVFAWGPPRGLRVSYDRGRTWTKPIAVDPNWVVTALAVDSAGRLFVGTNAHGAHYHEPDGTSWSGQAWQAFQNVTGGRVVGFVILPDPASSQPRYFVATRGSPSAAGSVFELDRATLSATSLVSGSSLPAGLPETVASGAGFVRRLNSLSGGADASAIVLYACLPSKGGSAWEGGVYRLAIGAPTQWQDAMGTGIDRTPGTNPALIAQYEYVAGIDQDPNQVFVSAGGGNRRTVYRSIDRGAAWTEVFTPANTARGWIDVERPGFGGPALGLAVRRPAGGSLADTRLLWANKGMAYASTDGGTTWRQAYSRQQGPLAPQAPWSSIGLEVTTAWHYYVDLLADGHRFIGYTDIGLAESTNGGTHWRTVPLPGRTASEAPYNNAYEIAFDPAVADRAWVAASRQHDIPFDSELFGANNTGGVVMRDPQHPDPARHTWHNSSAGLPPLPIVSIVLDRNSPVGARRLWASVYGDGVYVSVNGGESWQKQSNATLGFPADPATAPPRPENRHVYRLSRHQDGSLFCAVAGLRDPTTRDYFRASGLFRSANDGVSWTNITAGLNPWLARDYVVHPSNSAVIYLCTGNKPGADGAVYKTIDGGSSWSPVLDLGHFTKLPESQYRPFFGAFSAFLHPDDPDTVFATTRTHGAWTTRDGAKAPTDPHAWRELRNIPFISVNRITFEPTDPRSVKLSTFGGGVWPTSTRPVTIPTPPPNTWTQQSPATRPARRYGACMAYDGVRRRVVLFSGQNEVGGLNDTWTWNGVDWLEEQPAVRPPFTLYGHMAFDEARGEVVLFGGMTYGGAPLPATWVWDGSAWQQRATSGPPPRTSGVMAFDGTSVVLFGGYEYPSGTKLGDTWTWDGSAWTQRQPAMSPMARWSASMAYDPVHHNVVLFGGSSATQSLRDTWIWDGSAWTQRQPAADPNYRTSAAMAFDGRRVVLFGHGANVPPNDTWTWDGTSWMQRLPPVSPPGRRLGALAYFEAGDQALLFGGCPTPSCQGVLDDTWSWRS
jgi:hypothetical protein